jgi:hypothetical protein
MIVAAACTIRGVRAATVDDTPEIEITGGATSGAAATPPEGSAL